MSVVERTVKVKGKTVKSERNVNGKKLSVAKQATCGYCECEVNINPETEEWREWCPECIEILEAQALGECLGEEYDE